jgi:3D (Asp-Asp-Asp) domain-containing protein
MRVACRKLMLGFLISGTLSELVGCGAPVAPLPKRAAPSGASGTMSFTATAYSGGGLTASGTRPHPGVVAADPAVLPMGSRIRVLGAGQQSADYVVQDTGGKIRGRKIDIYLPTRHQAKRFGRRRVTVKVLRYGDGHRRRTCAHHCRKYRRHKVRHHSAHTDI